MSMRIRKLALPDRPALVAAIQSDATFSEAEVAVALELIDDALERDGVDYLVRVAEAPDAPARIAGYICFGPTPMTRSTWDLYWVVTHAACRGRGVAGSLIGAMESELRERGATGIRVETSQTEGYGAARNLYARYQYPEVARLGDFYGPGDDLIVYYKRL
jgi:ribosomal protein S18 acetylase RimI-like enzyme